MPINYGSKSNGDLQPHKTVMVTQVDIANLRCEVREVSGQSSFMVYLNTAVGHFYHYPNIGEQWVVTPVNGTWSFYRKTSAQNPAITALQDAAPGDIILGAQGNINVISPLVQAPVTNTWKIVGDNVLNQSLTEIFPPIPVKPNYIAKNNGNKLEMLMSGTFAVSYQAQTNTLATGRAIIEVIAGTYWRRNSFHDEDVAYVETTVALSKGDLITFNLYHSAGQTLQFTQTIDITQVR
jgi:hypothetical protein